MRRRCDVNRSFWCLASIVCLRFLAESFQPTGEGSVKVERSEPKGNLDGFLARRHREQKNEGKATSSVEPVTFGRRIEIRPLRLCSD
jgi:hypothetical protein